LLQQVGIEGPGRRVTVPPVVSKLAPLLCVLIVVTVGWGGCDDDDPPATDTYALSGASAKDEDIASDLARYIAYNYGRPDAPEPELTEKERTALGSLADNVLGLRTSIEGISVSDSVITVETNLEGSEESTTTSELICTVIYGADVADHINGHAVTASDDSTLVSCTHDTSPYEFASLSGLAQELVESSFTQLGASPSETRCAIEAFTQRVGVDELNAAAEEFKANDPGRFLSHRLDLVAVDEECDVDDHREVDCKEPRGHDERLLCREFERLKQG